MTPDLHSKKDKPNSLTKAFYMYSIKKAKEINQFRSGDVKERMNVKLESTR